jgi:urease accessory protein
VFGRGVPERAHGGNHLIFAVLALLDASFNGGCSGMKSSLTRFNQIAVASVPLFLASAGPAFAHHLMGGKLPDTFATGLLSGLGHPVIGLDHFAFIAGVGIASAFLTRGFIAVVAFIVATVAGCTLHLMSVSIPAVEIIVAASVLMIGVAIMSGRLLSADAATVLFAVAGLFHGYAYGESIFGAEQTPLAAYLVGFALIQTAIATGFMLLVRSLAPMRAGAAPSRLAGAVIAGIGLTFLVQNVQAVVLPLPPATAQVSGT